MGFENILTFDFFPLITGWGLFYYFCYSIKEEPVGLLEIEDLDQREKQRHEYYTNYPSLLHAVIMVIMSKYLARNGS
jgi:hypothetical protein